MRGVSQPCAFVFTRMKHFALTPPFFGGSVNGPNGIPTEGDNVGNNSASKRESGDASRRIAIGDSWRGLDRFFQDKNPSGNIFIKGFSVSWVRDLDNPYKRNYMLTLRAVDGQRRFVKFRRFESLERLGYVIQELLSDGEPWRDDKFDKEKKL